MAERKKVIVASVVIINNYLSNINNISNLENEFDDEMLMINALNRQKRTTIVGYNEEIVSSYSNYEFKSHFRLEKKTFYGLVDYLSPKYLKNHGPGQPEFAVEFQLKITLWILGNQEVYRSISDRFGVSMSVAWTSVQRISKLLVDNCADFIQWPRGQASVNVVTEWETKSGFPGIIGAIDGTYIPISTPFIHQESYVCRKKFHAIQLQGVCTSDKKFIDIDIGSPGSMHDARVFRRSDLFSMIQENVQQIFPNNTHMIGDSAYPLEHYLLVPFKKYGELSVAQKHFNEKLSSSRIIIEQAFGLLKSRFRRLKYMYMRRTELVPLLALACCILHNICIDNNDTIEVDDDLNTADLTIDLINDGEDFSTGREKRAEIMNYLVTL